MVSSTTLAGFCPAAPAESADLSEIFLRSPRKCFWARWMRFRRSAYLFFGGFLQRREEVNRGDAKIIRMGAARCELQVKLAQGSFDLWFANSHNMSIVSCAPTAKPAGNGQNALPVVAGMLTVALVIGAVSFALARFVRTVPLAILGTADITKLGFLLYFVCRVAFSQRLHEHVNEELHLLPVVFGVVTAPTIVLLHWIWQIGSQGIL